MKRLTSVILMLSLLLSLTACMNKDDISYSKPDNTPTNPQPTNPSGPLPPVAQKPMVSVSVPIVKETERASDGTVLFNYIYQNIELIVPDPDVAQKVILDFLNRIDQTTATANETRNAAKNAYKGDTNWSPYLCQITFDPMRVDYGILSMLGYNVVYNGTPHPNTDYLSVNYDLVNGKVLTLNSILAGNSNISTLCQYVIDSLTLQKNTANLFDGFESTVTDRFAKNLTLDTDWYFSETGLCFYFAPYDIAPYSSGVITAEVPYERLAGILNDAYFPAEKDTASGTIFAQMFLDAEIDSFSQFSEIVIDSNGDKVLLYTNQYVQNVRIESGSWSSDGSTFIPEHTVFAALSLTPGDAVMVESQLKTNAPSLRLSYQTGGKTMFFFITGTNNGSVELK